MLSRGKFFAENFYLCCISGGLPEIAAKPFFCDQIELAYPGVSVSVV